MNPQELYEKQYKEHELINYRSFFKKIFRKYDIDREDIVVPLLEKGDNLLDIGCGEGSLLFKARNRYVNLYGIDISPFRIEVAKSNFQKEGIENNRYILKVGDVDKGLHFKDNFFDAVTIISVLEHLFDPFSIIQSIKRVIKPSGILVVQVPNIAYLKYRVQLSVGRLPVTSSPYNWEKIGWDGGHLHYFTLRTLRWLLESQGFKIEKITGSGLFANLRNWWPSLLCGDIIIKARKIK